MPRPLTLPSISRLRNRWSTRLPVVLALFLLYWWSQHDTWAPGSDHARVPVTFGRSSLVLGPHGKAHGWQEGDTKHPIEALMENARVKQRELVERQSKTLPQAVAEYKRRYGRPPPRGFDKWWEFAVEHNVIMKDEYDQIYRDTHLFHGISPTLFRERFDKLSSQTDSGGHQFEIVLDPATGDVTSTGMEHRRRTDMRNLLSGIVRYLPARTRMVHSLHDMGSGLPGEDQRRFLEDKILRGEYATAEELKYYENVHRHAQKNIQGLATACPEDSPAWREAVDRPPKPHLRPVAVPADIDHPDFIWDHRASFDFCYDPSLLIFHGEFSYDYAKSADLRPDFVLSKFDRNGEFVVSTLDYYMNASSPEGRQSYLPWDQKTIPKVHWRGSMTGDFYDTRHDYNWRNSHRIRLHTKTHETEGESLVLIQGDDGGWRHRAFRNEMLNRAYMDIGLTGGPKQCNKDDGTCDALAEAIDFADRVNSDVAATYKYAIDVDGNGWSARYQRLLLSGAVVLKSTVFPEFNTDWLVPWYHYVPIHTSYAELYTTLAFFIGTPSNRRNNHDELAREIGENAHDFAVRFWRWEDMQSYMLRLLLEYIRLEHDDRDEWNYGP
ncbi:hypothetical protein Q5752_001147 [Cryptotrichosporon argae]